MDGGEVVEHAIGAVVGVAYGVREQVHLEQGLDQVAQHLHFSPAARQPRTLLKKSDVSLLFSSLLHSNVLLFCAI